MRVESRVLSISWIPSEAVTGMVKLPFSLGVTSYDDPPPDVVTDVEPLLEKGAFRFANLLHAWIEVGDDGRIIDFGHSGRGYINRTVVDLGPREMVFHPTPFPEIRPDPEAGDGEVRFVQTTGGRPGLPAPRYVRKKPFVQLVGPTVWTTLALTIRADGSSDFEVLGASEFPRHWIYDRDGALVAKVGVTDFEDWYRTRFGENTPWGASDSPVFLTAAETALEREMSLSIMRGGVRPQVRQIAEGAVLTEQGQEGSELYLVLDGVIDVEVDGEPVAQVGPGAVLGERALLEGGRRTSTLRAVTPCRIAVADESAVDRAALVELSRGHRREESL